MTRYRCDDPTCPMCKFVTGPDVVIRPAHMPQGTFDAWAQHFYGPLGPRMDLPTAIGHDEQNPDCACRWCSYLFPDRDPQSPPLVAGGQGRSDAQVASEGISVVAWVVIALAIGAVGFMVWLSGGL